MTQFLADDPHDRALLANVQPAEWTNPKPAPRYNVIVIGAGTAGLVTAAGGAMLGARVALVEKAQLGGDCLNSGCVPSKALLRSARAAADVRRAGEFGVVVPDGVRVDFPAIMERLRRLRAEISQHDSVARFRGLGVDIFLGEGRFEGADAISVNGVPLHFRRAVIATGSRPRIPDIPGLAEAGFFTSETIFALTALPGRLLVLGGGPIGCELAQAFARFGSQVWLVQSQPQLLPREDRDAAERIEAALRRDGVQIILGAQSKRVETRDQERVVEIEARGGQQRLTVDAILVSAGRTPNVESLNLEAAGVVADPRTGVQVTDRLQTTNPRVFAAGDVCSRYQFTHMADALARIVLRNALFPFGRSKASALTVPWCTYTDPEIAHVGLYQREAIELGIPVRTFYQELRDVDRAVLDGETEGFVKVLVREKKDQILGATIVARHAGDLISELTLAMVGQLGLGAIGRTIHPYPTQAEAIRKAADAHLLSRLTPLVKLLSQRWLAWARR